MIRTTPFHERTERAQRDGPVGALVELPRRPRRYQMSEKFEYFAIRNSAGLFDTSPLYKYRIHGPDAERFLAGVLARDIRTCPPGHAQYTVWCDDRGFVVEDGVILRHGPTSSCSPRPSRTSPTSRSWSAGSTSRSRTSPRTGRSWRSRARGRASSSRALAPGGRRAALLRPDRDEDRQGPGPRLADRLHRRPRLRGLGRRPADALPGLGRDLEASAAARASSRSG